MLKSVRDSFTHNSNSNVFPDDQGSPETEEVTAEPDQTVVVRPEEREGEGEEGGGDRVGCGFSPGLRGRDCLVAAL